MTNKTNKKNTERINYCECFTVGADLCVLSVNGKDWIHIPIDNIRNVEWLGINPHTKHGKKIAEISGTDTPSGTAILVDEEYIETPTKYDAVQRTLKKFREMRANFA